MKTFQQFQENKIKFALGVGKKVSKQVAPTANFLHGLMKLPKLKKNLEKNN